MGHDTLAAGTTVAESGRHPLSTATLSPAPSPLPIWRSVGQSFTILFGNLPSLMTLYAPMIVAWLLIALMQTGLKPEDPTLALVCYGLCAVAMTVASLVAAMALQIATLRHLRDGTFPTGPAAAEALPRLVPFVLLALIYLVLTFASMALLVIPALFVVPMIFLAPTIWLAERCTILEAFHRSAALTRGHRWRLLGILAMVFLGAVAVNLAFSLPKTLFGTTELLAAEAVAGVVSLVFHLLTTILLAIVYDRLSGEPRAAIHNPVL